MPTVQYSFKNVSWLPRDRKVFWKSHAELCQRLNKKISRTTYGLVDQDQFSLVILQLKDLIEQNGEVFRDFHEMFEQAPKNPESEITLIKDYIELLGHLNATIKTAPKFPSGDQASAAVPMYLLLEPFANTEAGYRAFTTPSVNARFRDIFNEWARYLVSPASREEVDTWLTPEALGVQEARLGLPFVQAWVCDDTLPHYGFTSWDEFFVRRFQAKARPQYLPENDAFINAACEAATTRISTDVQWTDEFWLKEMPYSLNHILNNHPLASQFVGGTVFQGLLSSLDYHRWQSPVRGQVVDTQLVPGTYYAGIVKKHETGDPDILTRSLPFTASISTRALIFIESKNPAIGLMCFVAVGLAEVSTTRLAVNPGSVLEKGTELGQFHFGGSTCLLIFRPETKLELVDEDSIWNQQNRDAENPKVTKVGNPLYYVTNTPANSE